MFPRGFFGRNNNNNIERPERRNAAVKDIAVVSQRRQGIKKMIKTLEERIKRLDQYKAYDPVVSTNNTPNSSRVVMASFTKQSQKFADDEIISLDKIIQGYRTQLNSLPNVYPKIIPSKNGKSKRRVHIVSYADPSRRGFFG
jgi:hypothetical protein